MLAALVEVAEARFICPGGRDDMAKLCTVWSCRLTAVWVQLQLAAVWGHIKQSKTDQHAFAHTVSPGAAGDKQCPVQIIPHFLTHWSTRPQQPLFIHCSGKPLTLQDYCHDICVLIKHIGLPLKIRTLTAYRSEQQLLGRQQKAHPKEPWKYRKIGDNEKGLDVRQRYPSKSKKY